jgi:hypothetical protein
MRQHDTAAAVSTIELAGRIRTRRAFVYRPVTAPVPSFLARLVAALIGGAR